jgi:glutamate-1-semialdehyde 2,1-aminomutase
MRLGRFFGRSSEKREPEGGRVDDEGVRRDDRPFGDVESEVPEFDPAAGDPDGAWRERAASLIPGGASTGSKRPEALYGDSEAMGPAHYVRASGCTVVTPGGQRLLDLGMALGAVSTGYADERILRAALSAAAAGQIATLSPTLEVEIAERLCEVVPCGEKVRFLKTGAEAVAAAVRIARTCTSRNVVIGCGYFGWLDWYRRDPGVPEGASACFVPVPFADADALERAVEAAGSDLAAIVLEPVVERLPPTEWLALARRLCDAAGAVLIFDEMKTGFRVARAGYQEVAGVVPDMAVYGKALAGGFPLAAVVGRQAIMDAAARSWISSTLAAETVALAAAGAVLDIYEQEDVCGELGRIGCALREAVERAIAACGLAGVEVAGCDHMWFLRFSESRWERRFLELAVSEGVLFKRGPYNYAALAHGEEDVAIEVERAASAALVALREEIAGERT